MVAKRRSWVKILIVNLHSSWNAGDDALLQEAIRQLQRHFPEAEFILCMNDPESYQGNEKAIGSFVTWVKHLREGQVPKWHWVGFLQLAVYTAVAFLEYKLGCRLRLPFASSEQKELLHAYLQADLIVSCAGNFLYGSGKFGISLLLALFSLYFGSLLGKPVYTLPQTLGPFHRKWESWLVRIVLSRLRLVLVRDPISAEFCARWGKQFINKWKLIPDLAFAFQSEEGEQSALRELMKKGVNPYIHRPLLGITLINWGGLNKNFKKQDLYEKTIEVAIQQFLETYGGKVVLFAQVQGPSSFEDDRIPARRVYDRLRDLTGKVVLVDHRLPPQILKALYGKMDLLLGSRLHSIIFALSETVPVVAIGYQYKTRGILRMLGLEEWALDITEVSPETLLPLLHKAWNDRERIRKHLRKVIPNLKKQAKTAGVLIAHDYGKY